MGPLAVMGIGAGLGALSGYIGNQSQNRERRRQQGVANRNYDYQQRVAPVQAMYGKPYQMPQRQYVPGQKNSWAAAAAGGLGGAGTGLGFYNALNKAGVFEESSSGVQLVDDSKESSGILPVGPYQDENQWMLPESIRDGGMQPEYGPVDHSGRSLAAVQAKEDSSWLPQPQFQQTVNARQQSPSREPMFRMDHTKRNEWFQTDTENRHTSDYGNK